MATIDLTNDIEPQNSARPVKPVLSDLRAAIKEADTEGVYADDYLDKCSRNDLVFIARSIGVELPIRFTPEPDEE